MENASKALIIAGAILLSILIIGLGMFIYNQAAGVMGDANLDPQKIQSYNSPFEQYEGTKSGTQVRALLDSIRQHNLANTDDPSLNIDVIEGSAADKDTAPEEKIETKKVNDVKAKIKAGKTYTVDFGYDKNSGFIIAVGIQNKENN